ncbi:MAG: transposase [Candidatus Omnitrophica bacterium]|nr:transposase [Candidatus Omnitrophota bacterium]
MSSQIYHVFNKSIEHFKIFNDDYDYQRFLCSLFFYQVKHREDKLSRYLRDNKQAMKSFSFDSLQQDNNENLVRFISYCLMPTHFHLILEVDDKCALSKFSNDVLNSYSRYFNTKHKRKGPLWVGRTKRVDVDTKDGMERLIDYVYNNPVKAGLVQTPNDWPWTMRR